MYKQAKYQFTKMKLVDQPKGESIEQKIERILANQEPIKDGAPLIYSERDHGVDPATDIRTDRFEIAVEAKDRNTKNILSKRAEKPADETPAAKAASDKRTPGGEPKGGTDTTS